MRESLAPTSHTRMSPSTRDGHDNSALPKPSEADHLRARLHHLQHVGRHLPLELPRCASANEAPDKAPAEVAQPLDGTPEETLRRVEAVLTARLNPLIKLDASPIGPTPPGMRP